MSPRTSFLAGMAICLVAAALMIAGAVDVAWGAAIGIVGVGVLGSAAARRTAES